MVHRTARFLFIFVLASLTACANFVATPTATAIPSRTSTATPAPTRTIPPSPTITFTPTPSLPPLIANYVAAHPDAKYTVTPDGATHLYLAPETPLTDDQLLAAVNEVTPPGRDNFIMTDDHIGVAIDGVWNGAELIIHPDGRPVIVASFVSSRNHRKLEKLNNVFVVPDVYNEATKFVYAQLGLKKDFSAEDIRALFAPGKPIKITIAFDLRGRNSALVQNYEYRQYFADENYIKQLQRWYNGELTAEEIAQMMFFEFGIRD